MRTTPGRRTWPTTWTSSTAAAVGKPEAPVGVNAAGTVLATRPPGGPCAEAAIGRGWADARAHATRIPSTTAAAIRRTNRPRTARRRGLARTPRKAMGTVRITGLGGVERRWRPRPVSYTHLTPPPHQAV